MYFAVHLAYPDKSDREIVAELMRMVTLVAVSYNDVIEGGDDPYEVFRRFLFEECDELAHYFPWPSE